MIKIQVSLFFFFLFPFSSAQLSFSVAISCLIFQELSGLVYFVLGAIAKAVSTVITYPLQVVQSRLRVSVLLCLCVGGRGIAEVEGEGFDLLVLQFFLT